jgi:dihydrodipicolinate synthase/N-acetylneuraminate lyase
MAAYPMPPAEIVSRLRGGVVIPAHPLALKADRTLDEQRQRALTRYYLAAGAGGVAVGVHTTQFEIREHGLYQRVLQLAADTVREFERNHVQSGAPVIRVAGLVGPTPQALGEAKQAKELGYHAGLLSLAALRQASDAELIAHCRAVAEVLPLMGFYLQHSVGGRPLGYDFWRAFAEIPNVVAIKIAPFDRYLTQVVLRAVYDAGRARDIALYTGNDDNILLDLLTGHRFNEATRLATGSGEPVRITGGLLGHWAVWTKSAVEQLLAIKELVSSGAPIPQAMLTLAAQVTDANSAFFDPGHQYAGCIAGIHEVLRRQGLMAGRWTLNPKEDLSPGQDAEIERVYAAYPHLNDDAFVRANLAEWMRA